MSADTDLALHDAWARACGGSPAATLTLITHLVTRIDQPSIESQSRKREEVVADALWLAMAGVVARLRSSEIAAWLAAAGLGLSFESWCEQQEADRA